MTVINLNGTEIDFDAAVPYMDDELREEVHTFCYGHDEQRFFTLYEVLHWHTHGEPWELSKANPVW